MTRLARNAFVYVAGNIAAAGVPFLLMPVLVRVLSPSEYGVIAMFMALLAVLAPFTGLNVHAAINVHYFDRDERQFATFVSSSLLLLVASSLVVLVLVSLFDEALSRFTGVPPAWVKAAVVVAALSSVVQIRLGLWMVKEQAVRYGAFQLLRSLVEAALSLYLVVLLLEGFEGRLYARTVAVALFAAVGVAGILRYYRAAPDLGSVREAFLFGAPLVPHILGTFFIAAGDRFIINAHLGLDQAGIYLVAVQLGLAMQIAMEAFNRAFVPWLYRQLREGEPKMLKRIAANTWRYFALVLSAAALVALVSGPLVNLVAGPAYTAAAPALAWIALGQAFNGMYLMVTNYNFYAKQTGQLSWVTLSTGVVALTVTFLLVPHFGITGAAFSFAFAMLLKFLFTWRLAQRAYPMPWWPVSMMGEGKRP